MRAVQRWQATSDRPRNMARLTPSLLAFPVGDDAKLDHLQQTLDGFLIGVTSTHHVEDSIVNTPEPILVG